MNHELARKQPAQVISRRPAPRGPVREVANLAAPTKAELLAALSRQQRAGLIESTNSEIRLITEGDKAGWYAVRVTRMPPRPATTPTWARTCIAIGAVLTGLAALGLAGAWVLTAMDRASLVAAVVTVLGMFIIWVWAKCGRRRDRSVVVGVRVEIR